MRFFFLFLACVVILFLFLAPAFIRFGCVDAAVELRNILERHSSAGVQRR